MSKAEERALEVYPIESHEMYDDLYRQRNAYVKGYYQAEKDNELTWEDIKIILDIEIDILHKCNSKKELVLETYPKGKDYYGEILKRFNKERK